MKHQFQNIINQKVNQRKIDKRILIADIISAVVLLLFLYTAISKLLDYDNFKSVLIMSPLLRPFAGVIAWTLPILEIGIAMLLLFPKTRLYGLYAALAALTGFTLYIIYMIIFSFQLPCGCGGVLKTLTWHQHILFNLFCSMAVVVSSLLYRHFKIKSAVPP